MDSDAERHADRYRHGDCQPDGHGNPDTDGDRDAHVDAHTARVQLITDAYTRLAVAVRAADGERATARMRGGFDDDVPLRSLRASYDLRLGAGDPVLTSHDDGVVPAGLIVGYVTRASDDDGDGVLDVRVHPLFDLGRSTTLLVLRPER